MKLDDVRSRLYGFVVAAGIVSLAAATALTPAAVAAPGSGGPETGSTYQNPVLRAQAPDPSVIRGRDGMWYAYTTGGGIRIWRSSDLVHWSHLDDVFTDATIPTWDGEGPDANRAFWAPDIQYLDGRYVLYYSFVVNRPGDHHFRAIAAATAPAPGGPWTDSGHAVVETERWEPRPGTTAWANTIDPGMFTSPDGTRYLTWGSINGGVRMARLTADGLHVTGERTQLTPELRYEASYVVRRDGWYYLMLSVIGGCCAGPDSAYPVMVARSKSPTGPYVDRNGVPVNTDAAGGTPVGWPTGNQWVSTGHNAVATDPSGQEWMVTHGYDRFHPKIDGRGTRTLLISRLDWIDGWPVVRAGAGIAGGPARAPAMGTFVTDAFEDDAHTAQTWTAESLASWQRHSAVDGGFLVAQASGDSELSAAASVRGDLRYHAVIKTPASGQAELRLQGAGDSPQATVTLDAAHHELVLSMMVGDKHTSVSHELPARFDPADWHALTLERRGAALSASVAPSGVGSRNPLVELSLNAQLPMAKLTVGVTASAGTQVDDITVSPLYRPVTERVPVPHVGTTIPGTQTDLTSAPSDDWRWVRGPSGTITSKGLQFPVSDGTLIDARSGPTDNVPLLLRNAPKGTWTAEVKVTLPLGDSLPNRWPEAGLIAYTDDDHWASLGTSGRNSVRWTMFYHEMTHPDYGNTALHAYAALPGSADTMWLRLTHTVDPETGEHDYRASTSRDGHQWDWFGTRVLPAGPTPQIGLMAFDADPGIAMTATFTDFRLLTP